MDTQVFQTNPRLRGLLLILIFTFAASGIALAVLAQINAYHREQIYLATESALPVHRTTALPSASAKASADTPLSNKDMEGWKTYRNEEYGFEMQYPYDWTLDSQIIDKVGSVEEGFRILAAHFAIYPPKTSNRISRKLEIFLMPKISFEYNNLKFLEQKLLGDKSWELRESIDGPGAGTKYYILEAASLIIQAGAYDFENISANSGYLKSVEKILSTFKFTPTP